MITSEINKEESLRQYGLRQWEKNEVKHKCKKTVKVTQAEEESEMQHNTQRYIKDTKRTVMKSK